MNELQIFSNSGFGDIRTIMVDGKVAFNATDIAKALGYKKPNNAIQQHCKATLKQGSRSNGGLEGETNYL